MSHRQIWLAASIERKQDISLFDDANNPLSTETDEPGVVWGFVSQDKRQTLASIRSKISNVIENAVSSYFSTADFGNDIPMINTVLSQLQKDLGLPRLPYHIEAIDVSHIQGDWCAGGLSCLKAGIPYPKGYRQYKLKGNNDIVNLCTIVKKRLLSSEKGQPLPDLLLIDGGKGQVNAIMTMIKQQFPEKITGMMILGCTKGEARKQNQIGKQIVKKTSRETIKEEFILVDEQGNMTIYPCTYSAGEKILLKARDEAHRFANRYRTKQMSMEWKM